MEERKLVALLNVQHATVIGMRTALEDLREVAMDAIDEGRRIDGNELLELLDRCEERVEEFVDGAIEVNE